MKNCACTGGVYLFEQDDCIKIGQTGNFKKRFTQFLCNPNSELELIALIGEDDKDLRIRREAYLLDRYAESRIVGEYFNRSFQLLSDFELFGGPGKGKFPPYKVVVPQDEPKLCYYAPLPRLTRKALASGVVPCSSPFEADL